MPFTKAPENNMAESEGEDKATVKYSNGFLLSSTSPLSVKSVCPFNVLQHIIAINNRKIFTTLLIIKSFVAHRMYPINRAFHLYL